MRALILSGVGRYSDPWHPFEQTSVMLAGILAEASFDTEIAVDVERALADLLDDQTTTLLVVNAGDPWRSDVAAGDLEAANRGFEAAIQRGIGVLAFHAAVASLRDIRAWAGVVGGVWLPGLSFHPPLETFEIRLGGHRHPVTSGLTDFVVKDERYCRLQGTGIVDVLAEYDGVDRLEPALWTREFQGSRVVYDALGHDTRAYTSPEHRRLIANAARWAARAERPSTGP